MNHQNTYFAASIRNSYGYQDNSALRPNLSKPYQPFNSSFQHDSKVANSIRVMESRVDGVEAMVRQKKNSINEDIQKFNVNPTSSTFQPYEPVKYNPSLNNNSQNIGE